MVSQTPSRRLCRVTVVARIRTTQLIRGSVCRTAQRFDAPDQRAGLGVAAELVIHGCDGAPQRGHVLRARRDELLAGPAEVSGRFAVFQAMAGGLSGYRGRDRLAKDVPLVRGEGVERGLVREQDEWPGPEVDVRGQVLGAGAVAVAIDRVELLLDGAEARDRSAGRERHRRRAEGAEGRVRDA